MLIGDGKSRLEVQLPFHRIVSTIEAHLSKNADRAAAVVVGPRREGWFNSEAFVALMEAINVFEDGGFSVYGEENFNTALAKLGWPIASGDPGKLPDLVGYGADDNVAPTFILESKLVYSDDVGAGQPAIRTLSAQLANARAIAPSVPILGVVYAVQSPRPGDAGAFLKRLSTVMENELSASAGFDWVGGPVHCIEGLNQRATNFAGFSCYSTVAIGVRAAR